MDICGSFASDEVWSEDWFRDEMDDDDDDTNWG